MVNMRSVIVLALSSSLWLPGCGSSQDKPATSESVEPAPAGGAGWVEVASGARYREVAGGERIYHYPGSGPIVYAPADSGPHLVAVTRPLTAADRAALGALGVTASEPNLQGANRYLYRLDPEARAAIERLDFVTGVTALQPEEKLDPQRLGPGPGTVTVTVDLLAVSAAKQTALGELFASWGATLHFSGRDTLRLTIDRARLGELGRISDVIWIEPRPEVAP